MTTSDKIKLVEKVIGTGDVVIEINEINKFKKIGIEKIVYRKNGKLKFAPLIFFDGAFETSEDFIDFHIQIWPELHI